jgi:hypothetical protein
MRLVETIEREDSLIHCGLAVSMTGYQLEGSAWEGDWCHMTFFD